MMQCNDSEAFASSLLAMLNYNDRGAFVSSLFVVMYCTNSSKLRGGGGRKGDRQTGRQTDIDTEGETQREREKNSSSSTNINNSNVNNSNNNNSIYLSYRLLTIDHYHGLQLLYEHFSCSDIIRYCYD